MLALSRDLVCHMSSKCHTRTVHLFFFTKTPTTETYTLSLHDALPISPRHLRRLGRRHQARHHTRRDQQRRRRPHHRQAPRSEEHTSELQSHVNLVCRLLLEKKKK